MIRVEPGVGHEPAIGRVDVGEHPAMGPLRIGDPLEAEASPTLVDGRERLRKAFDLPEGGE
jgi:hypothetical protein